MNDFIIGKGNYDLQELINFIPGTIKENHDILIDVTNFIYANMEYMPIEVALRQLEPHEMLKSFIDNERKIDDDFVLRVEDLLINIIKH